MKILTSLVASLAGALVGCGGGGASSVVIQLDQYIGTWSGCADAEKMIVTLEPASGNSLNLSLVAEYFENSDCSGPVAGAASYSSPLAVLTYESTDSILIEDPISYPVELLGTHSVDIFDSTAQAGTVSLTGNVDVNNCIVGTGFCFDQLSYPQTRKRVAFNLANGVMTPINFVNAAGDNWYADEITWQRTD